MEKDSALLVVDVQNDFCPGGALGIQFGDEIVPVLNGYLELFVRERLPVIASRDWHPPETAHFARFGGTWPEHCIRGSRGAEFHPDLRLPANAVVLSKGIDPQRDGYSAFEGVAEDGRDLHRLLQDLGVKTLCIGGLATEYCVLFTVRDALRLGYRAVLLHDAVKGVDPAGSAHALEEMKELGVEMVTFEIVARDCSS